jgi:CRP-like cAMP-binding protein
MSEIFRRHVQKFVDIGSDEFVAVADFFQTQEVKKKANLLSEGKLCKYNYFVLSGCLRKYFVNEKGVEQTTEFAIENWWMTDNVAFEHQRPSEFFIQSVEPTTVLRIDFRAQQELLARHPGMERYFRFVYQRAFGAAEMRIKYLFGFSKDEMFYHFLQHYPDFVRRVPQHLLASFLGFTPEYLSEIKKKHSLKPV